MAQNAAKLRCVLLLHTLPGGTAHRDWMIEIDDGPLVTFRVALDVNPLADQSFEAERIGMHRRDYLDYEGPISDDRGSVVRVAEGLVSVIAAAPNRLDLTIDGRSVVGNRVRGADWRFQASDPR